MSDGARFAAAWATLLVIVAIVQWLHRDAPAPPCEHGVVLLQLRTLAALRWWAFPLLYAAAFAGAFGFDRIDDGLCDLVCARGWKVLTRPKV